MNIFVVFTLESQRYALPLEKVERIVRVVEITPLPKAPPLVLGIINVEGRIVPVMNVRRLFRLPDREVDLSDQLILMHAPRRTYALLADGVEGLANLPTAERVASEKIFPGMEYVEEIAKQDGRMILVLNSNKFLSFLEKEKWEGAIQAA